MFDSLFPFVDPIFEPTKESLFAFIAQAEAYFDVLEENGELPVKIQRPLSEDTYKQMWMLRYQQHLGNLSFLELLSKYEEILGIVAHFIDRYSTVHKNRFNLRPLKSPNKPKDPTGREVPLRGT